MAAVLKLSDGTNTVDFVSGGSEYKLRQNGLNMPHPETNRVLGGDPMLAEGARLIDRQLSNREISITFNIDAATHNGLVSNMRTLRRLLDTAKKSNKDGLGPKVVLSYKFDDASEQVAFDVIDGEFQPGQLADPTVRRASLLRDSELTLICEPYARLDQTTGIEIRNLLLNPSFDWNPEQGGDATVYELDLGAAGVRLERASGVGLSDDILSVVFWFKRDALSGTRTIIICGTTTKAWRVFFDTGNKLNFEWYDAGGTQRLLTAADVITDTTTWHCAAMTVFPDPLGAINTFSVLMVDGVVQATNILANVGIRAPVGAFVVGSVDQADGERFDGRISGLAILVNKPVHPHQLRYLYMYGLRGLWLTPSGTAGHILPKNYMGLSAADVGGIWSFSATDSPADTGSTIQDRSGNGRHITITGSPANTAHIRTPSGWVRGSGLTASSGLQAASDNVKFGAFSFVLSESGAANKTLRQTVVVPEGVTTATVYLWIKGGGGANQVVIDIDGVTETITATNGVWKQFIKTVTVGASSILTIQWLSGGATTVYIDGVVFTPGQPFGSFASFTEVTGDPKPTIGSSFLRAYPDSTRVFWLPIYDIPGDAPATCRVYLKNTAGAALGPVRLGAAYGQDPGKAVFYWAASQFIPNMGASGDWVTGADGGVAGGGAANVLADIAAINLGTLFPFPDSQFGSFKGYIGVASALNRTSFLRLASSIYTVALTGDPIKDTNPASALIHMVDGGLLSWPPAFGASQFRAATKVTGSPRTVDDLMYPRLLISAIDPVQVDRTYKYLYLLPIENFFTLQPDKIHSADSSLQANEILVVDTIDEEAPSIAYLMLDVNSIPAAVSILDRLVSLRSANVSMFGDGFYLEPGKPGAIVALYSRSTDDADKPFGSFTVGTTTEMWIEYMPRFLYV